MQFLKPVTPFKFHLDHLNRSKNWDIFKQDLYSFFKGIEAIKGDPLKNDEKIAVFLNLIGNEGLDILNRICVKHKENIDFQTILVETERFINSSLYEYELHAKNKFRCRMQSLTETVDDYFLALKQLARACNFTNENEVIKEQLKTGIRSKIIHPAFSKIKEDMDVYQVLDVCRQIESFQLTEDRFKAARVSPNTRWINISPGLNLVSTTTVNTNVNIFNINIDRLIIMAAKLLPNK